MNEKYVEALLYLAAGMGFLTDLVLVLRSRKEKPEKTGLKVFILERYFCIGQAVRRKLKLKSRLQNKRRQLLLQIYPSTEAVKISENASNAPLSYIFMFVPCVLLIFAFTKNRMAVTALTALVVFLCFYFDIWISAKIRERHAEILEQYAAILTKMSLLVNAGITAAEAFSRVANSGQGVLYREMQKTVSDISNGMSHEEALNALALRGGLKEVKKFVSLYKQNLIKGGVEFPFLLSQMADEAWNERRNRAKLLGGVASQKLLAPIMLLFTGILLMVIVPAFGSLI